MAAVEKVRGEKLDGSDRCDMESGHQPESRLCIDKPYCDERLGILPAPPTPVDTESVDPPPYQRFGSRDDLIIIRPYWEHPFLRLPLELREHIYKILIPLELREQISNHPTLFHADNDQTAIDLDCLNRSPVHLSSSKVSRAFRREFLDVLFAETPLVFWAGNSGALSRTQGSKNWAKKQDEIAISCIRKVVFKHCHKGHSAWIEIDVVRGKVGLLKDYFEECVKCDAEMVIFSIVMTLRGLLAALPHERGRKRLNKFTLLEMIEAAGQMCVKCTNDKTPAPYNSHKLWLDQPAGRESRGAPNTKTSDA